MAGAALKQFPNLTSDQQELLLRALSSQRRTEEVTDISKMTSSRFGQGSPSARQPMVASPPGINPAELDASKQSNDLASSTRFDPEAFNEESLAEFAASADFNFDDLDFAGDLSNLPNDTVKTESRESLDGHGGEKRKSPEDYDDDEDDEDDDHDPKRSGEKINKKPGRKPLTTEPTTKRKAQNRAAQRAFRERKEKHLKDLEQKVHDLEKQSEATTNENGLLRAQVTRLQAEMKQYRKRMSASFSNTSPRNSLGTSNDVSASFGSSFPSFDALPNFNTTTSPISYFSNSSAQQTFQSPVDNNSDSRQNSKSLSPRSNSSGQTHTSPANNYSNGQTSSSTPSDNWTDLFSPQQMRSGSESSYSTHASPANQASSSFNSRKYSENAGNGVAKPRQDLQKAMSTSSSVASPSSYAGLNGANSSCCTSPEPYRDSPQNKTIDNPANNDVSTDTLANGFFFNNNTTAMPTTGQTPENGFDWLASQNGNFDPTLFGDYRESQAAVIGTGDFTGGFFEESMNFANMNDPFSFNLSTDHTVPAPVHQKPSLLEQVEMQRDGDDSLSTFQNPSTDEKELMTAHKIWNSLQNCPKFKSGDFDIDGLCSELQTKAKCSETGLVVPKADVEAALWRLAGGDQQAQQNGTNGH